MSQSSDAGASESQESSDTMMGRHLRHAYRTGIDQVDEAENRPYETLQVAQGLFGDVARTPEAVLDSVLVSLAASKGRQLATALQVNQQCKFDPEVFAVRVRDFVSEPSQTDPLTEKAWAELGKLAQGTVKTSQPFWYLYGSAGDAPAKTRQAPVRRTVQDAPDRAPTVPKQVRSVEQTNQETTTERVGVIHQLLRDLYEQFGHPLPYIEFILHPQSFGKTCENIFHLSFLINEGHARIKCDESNLLVVEPVFGNTSAEREANKNGVFVMTLNFVQWQDAVKTLGVMQPVIPDL
ncbi:hypothetical protein HPB49_011886 [Dermacentor silvarum]|uniref:Uncharacterized protein n=1 Tax=Dermacentor silvarum TaxID=543639 RepID=A0ACB8D5M7_DERSI|nr:non-structural maintenance of chromosomes element 4 homolog A [Dermacentor silvarum]KAH7959564.1 hypothetical protein HPB49_011886 [Dermacentor silvarum]